MNRIWYGLLNGRILKTALAGIIAVGAFAVATAPAWANAANPDPTTTGTEVVNADGTVTAHLSGTWSWPGQACSGRYGEGWAVDWWGISATKIPVPSFSLTNASEVNPPGTTTTGTISPNGAIQIGKNGPYFHVAQFYAGETINSAATCTDTGSGNTAGSKGSWSATATYPSLADIPPQVCVNMYDEHGKEGQMSNSAKDYSPSENDDNSIDTNAFDPTSGKGYCVSLAPPPSTYLGYADSYPPRIATPDFPDPWRGGQSVLDPSQPVLYVGCGYSGTDTCPTIPATGANWYDGGAIRIDNPVNGSPITFTGTGSKITIGYCTYTPWDGLTATVQPGQTMILDETGGQEPCGAQVFAHTGINVQPLTFPLNDNADTTESYAQSANYLSYVQGGPAVCTNDGLIPVVTLELNGETSTITDNNQIMNDGGVDRGGPICGVNFTANSTNGSNVLTNVSTPQGGTTGLAAGNDITGAGFPQGFTVGEAILSVNPGADTITVSAAANATQVGLQEEELFSEANPWSKSGVTVSGGPLAGMAADRAAVRTVKAKTHRRSTRAHKRHVKVRRHVKVVRHVRGRDMTR